MAIQVSAIKAFSDNYIWCIHDSQYAVVVDPGDAAPVKDFIKAQGLTLTDILVTHHHFDHTGGIADLQDAFDNLHVTGPTNPKIKGLTKTVVEGDKISVLNQQLSFEILETPGHTLDHIVFFNGQWLFCGDTLFSAGCGRMFEGTPEVFLTSLDKLAHLPGHLKVFCTHEYTLANLKFARHLLPKHTELADYEAWAQQQRHEDKITLPSTIDQQRAINPFLMCQQANFQRQMKEKLQQNLNNAVDTFAAIRSAKDNF
jgi:hydroxyacylglutathione hydrolase